MKYLRLNIHTGNEVVIVKSGRRICGSGAALGTAPILQNKGYFEVKIQSGGNYQIVMDRLLFYNKYKYLNCYSSWWKRTEGVIFGLKIEFQVKCTQNSDNPWFKVFIIMSLSWEELTFRVSAVTKNSTFSCLLYSLVYFNIPFFQTTF